MRIISGLVVMFLALSLPLSTARADAREDILKVISVLDRAIKAKDGVTLHRVYDPDGHFVGLEGKPANQKQYVQAVLSDPMKIQACKSDYDVLRISGDTALEMGTFTASGTTKGKPARNQLRYMTWWTKKNGQWVITAEQLTAVKAANK